MHAWKGTFATSTVMTRPIEERVGDYALFHGARDSSNPLLTPARPEIIKRVRLNRECKKWTFCTPDARYCCRYSIAYSLMVSDAYNF
jgi:hypothetical protein